METLTSWPVHRRMCVSSVQEFLSLSKPSHSWVFLNNGLLLPVQLTVIGNLCE
uniref:Uncharacterized protein n=1 Tax=Physcomitrium patens TaxID=3218 RepID=A0A2K1IRK2_PHYPA|nr:hypothetical protein PHYPA_026024 [Physcomitrium patens]